MINLLWLHDCQYKVKYMFHDSQNKLNDRVGLLLFELILFGKCSGLINLGRFFFSPRFPKTFLVSENRKVCYFSLG